MTKRLFAGSIAIVLASGLAGCVDQPELSSTGGISFEAFKARTYREPSTGLYVLDWDTVVSGDDALAEVWAATQQGALAVYAQNGIDIKWDSTQRKNLTYCVSDTFGANKQAVVDAMRTAAENGWEKMADVNYTYVPAQDANCNASNTSVLFDVNPVNANGEYLARSFFPNSPRVERNVLIDNTVFQAGGTGGVPFANILAHELGHTLGFRHEHIRPEANATDCIEDNEFRGLTTYDSASVMHYPQCNGTSTTLAFTQKDREGVVSLYGSPLANTSPMTQVTAPSDGATVGTSFSVEAAIVDGDLMRAELYIDGTLSSTLTTGPFTFVVSNVSLGAHSLEIKATDSANQTTTQTISVVVAAGGGNGSGTGTGEGGQDEYGDVVGGCSTGSGQGSALVLFALAGLVTVRRRRVR
jgi:MYXO-CTERM domain-containing protein